MSRRKPKLRISAWRHMRRHWPYQGDKGVVFEGVEVCEDKHIEPNGGYTPSTDVSTYDRSRRRETEEHSAPVERSNALFVSKKSGVGPCSDDDIAAAIETDSSSTTADAESNSINLRGLSKIWSWKALLCRTVCLVHKTALCT